METKMPRAKVTPRVKLEASLRPEVRDRMAVVAADENKLLARWAADTLIAALERAERRAKTSNQDRAQIAALGGK